MLKEKPESASQISDIRSEVSSSRNGVVAAGDEACEIDFMSQMSVFLRFTLAGLGDSGSRLDSREDALVEARDDVFEMTESKSIIRFDRMIFGFL